MCVFLFLNVDFQNLISYFSTDKPQGNTSITYAAPKVIFIKQNKHVNFFIIKYK